MQMGMVGLGRMGANMTRRLMRGGHTMVVSDLSADAVKGLAGEGAVASSLLDDLVRKLSAPRAAWIMVPSGDPTEKTVQALLAKMQTGDTIIDGGNSYFKDEFAASKICAAKGVHYVDVGTSGGVWGLERGYCMMIGGPKKRSTVSTRFSKRWRPDAATFRALRDARNGGAAASLKTVTSTVGRRARDIS